jgi:hypothetical protein
MRAVLRNVSLVPVRNRTTPLCYGLTDRAQAPDDSRALHG